MSTKIYNGFIFKNAKTMDDAFFQLKECREIMRKKAFRLFLKEVIREAVFLFDKKAPISHNSYYLTASQSLLDQHHKNMKDRCSCYDFSFKVGMASLVDGQNSKIMGYFFSGHESLTNEFKNFKFFESYGYWDNSDKPNKVTNEAWEQCKNDWSKVAGKDTLFSEFMMILELVNEFDFTYRYDSSEENTDEFIPSHDERLNHLARHLVDKDNHLEHFYPKMENFSDYIRYFQSKEFLDLVNKKKMTITLEPVTIETLKTVQKD
jgi:hypothetical protein